MPTPMVDGVGLALVHRDPDRQLLHSLREVGGGQLAGLLERGHRLLLGSSQEASAVLRDALVLQELHEPLALAGGDGIAARPLHDRGVAHRDGPQRPSHRQHAHQRAVLEERPLHVRRVGRPHPLDRRQHHGGGVGGVEHHHRSRDGDHVVVDASARRQAMALRDPGSALARP